MFLKITRLWYTCSFVICVFINKKQLSSSNKPLIVVERYEDNFKGGDYFKEEVRKQLNNLLGNKSLYEEGFIIKTSINTNLQKTLDKVLIEGLIKQDKKSGWKGPINNLDKSINFDTFLKEIKSPFPDNWKIYQTISSEKIKMTVPVTQSIKIDMTSPVTQSNKNGKSRFHWMAFLI